MPVSRWGLGVQILPSLLGCVDNDIHDPVLGGYVNFLAALLNMVRVLREDLEEVHEQMKEDVDYIVGKTAWIALLEEFEEAPSGWGAHGT